MPSDVGFTSPNFGFLAKDEPLLVRYAAQAERYLFDDPNTSLFKLRQFAELLAQKAAAEAGSYVDQEENQVSLLRRLYDSRITPPEISELFHGIRKSGNTAAHAHVDDRREAFHQLKMARKLAVWFRKTFADKNFKAGPFVAPPDPTDAQQALIEELELARQTALAERLRAEQAEKTAAERAEMLELAEAEAETRFQELNTAMELASEVEEQLAETKQQLANRQLETAKASREERAAVVQAAVTAAESLELDEAETRTIIDGQLRDHGWEVDSQVLRYAKGTRPQKGKNLAIAEWPTAKGPADYVLFIGLTPIAVVEAKRKQVNVAGAIEQAKRYSRGFQLDEGQQSPGGPWGEFNIPFLFAANGRPYHRQVAELSGIRFQDIRLETNHSRTLASWYTPEGLKQLLAQDTTAADARLEAEPTDYLPLRSYQADAVRCVEAAIANGQQEILVAMATGTGKTITCIGLIYRLIKAKRFRRILFLVDRTALGEQTSDKFKDVRLENLQTFPDIYDVKELGDLHPDSDTKLHISTVQGMVKRLLYSDETVPVDWYDCVVIDECHRGYNLDQEMSDAEMQFRSEDDYISKYRRVIDHFDAVRIGLTATPALHTTDIFGEPVYQYSYRQAVIDGYLVDHEPPHQIVTKLSQDGMKWEVGDEIKTVDVQSGQLDLFHTPDEVNIEVDHFNRQVITENFNRTVCQSLAARIDPDLPGKTLIFCVNDLHADLVERLMTEALEDQYGPVHDDTVKKITGKSDKPLELIRRYKNEQLPKIAVTVDLMTTGIDVPEIVNLVFIRRVRSRILYEQMLGRATRLCEDLFGSDEDKDRFHVFDAVGLYAALQNVSDMKPVVTKPNVTVDQLITELCTIQDEGFQSQVKDQLLAKLQRTKLDDAQTEQLQTATGLDRRGLIAHISKTTPTNLAEWFKDHPMVASIFMMPKEKHAKYIVSDHEDELVSVERGYGDGSRPEDYLEAFRQYILTHEDELPALIVVTQRPRELTREQLRGIRLHLDQQGFSETNLRTAIRETTNQDIAATIIGYIRHVALDKPLVSHKDRVQAAMKQIQSSRTWTEPQRKWLERIGKQLEQETIVDREALDSGQFKAQGGFQRLNKVFEGELETILRDIADAMWQAAA